MFLGDLRLMCKDWRTAVDASDGGLRRWELRARLFQTPRLPTAAASVEALDLRGLFPHSEIGPLWVPAAGLCRRAGPAAAAGGIPCAAVPHAASTRHERVRAGRTSCA